MSVGVCVCVCVYARVNLSANNNTTLVALSLQLKVVWLEHPRMKVRSLEGGSQALRNAGPLIRWRGCLNPS